MAAPDCIFGELRDAVRTMKPSVIAFATMMGLTGLLLAVMTAREMDFHFFPETQIGDSSLGRHSVDKLAITAFASALVICLL